MKANAWDIYRSEDSYKDGKKPFDTVFYNVDCDHDYVRDGLINHDGYSPNIFVKLAK